MDIQRSASIDDILQQLASAPTEDSWSFDWDETTTAQLAVYHAFKKYINGDDLYLLPRTRNELESILRRYARDAVHNAIALSRCALPLGGYSQVCHLSEKNIQTILDFNDTSAILLALHSRQVKEADNYVNNNTSPTRPITTN